MMDPKLDEDLTDLWYNLENSSAFSGLANLYKVVKEKRLPYNRKQVRDWLHWQKTYTLHFPTKKRFKRARIISYGPNWLVEGDLGIISDLKHYTSNYQYILLMVCTFTKRIFARPLKTKTGPEVADALKEYFAEAKERNFPVVYFRTGSQTHIRGLFTNYLTL